jgi:quercetin dioxygenase-like cupin family protein
MQASQEFLQAKETCSLQHHNLKTNMDKPALLSPAITLPGAGKVIRAFGDEVTVLLSGEQTGGAFTMVLSVTPPGGGPPPHYHMKEDEWFYVQEGRVEFLVNGEWQEVPPGTSAFMPRESKHTFRNVGDTPLRMIIHAAPSGFETFFERAAEAFNAPGGPDMPRIIEISAEHGIYFLPPEDS